MLKVTILEENNTLVAKIRSSRKYYDYTIKSLTELCDKYVILEFYLDNVKTKYGKDKIMFVVSEVDEALLERYLNGEDVDPRIGPVKYKVFTGSKRLRSVFGMIKESGIDNFPILLKFEKRSRLDTKTGNSITYFDVAI